MADVGEGADAEEGEGVLGLPELEVAEEDVVGFGSGCGVFGEGGGYESELGSELGEVEVGFGSELGGVEEDDEGVGAGSGGVGDEAGDGSVV